VRRAPAYHRAVASDRDDRRQQYEHEAETLAQVGAAVFLQPTRVSVRLPGELAGLALAAWRQDSDSRPLGPETPEQRITRRRAGALALIGLCIEKTGRPDQDKVVCELDSWYLGQALDAAEDRGLLADLIRTASRGEPAEPGGTPG
jgi:hypothetical protein